MNCDVNRDDEDNRDLVTIFEDNATNPWAILTDCEDE